MAESEGAWSRRLSSAFWEGVGAFEEEPRKQKTRRPERRGTARAVSPEKIGKRKKGKVEVRESRREGRAKQWSDAVRSV
jgi:hypothetical protein